MEAPRFSFRVTPGRAVPGVFRRPVFVLRQSGAVAVEFAFVFPLLFLLMYGIVVYSYVFVLNSALQFAAQEAAESVVQVAPEAAESVKKQRAQSTARAVLDWLPSGQRSRAIGENGEKVEVGFCPGFAGEACPECPAGATDCGAVVVTLVFSLLSPPLFPSLTLPFVGTVPPLPEKLTAQAVARI